MSIAKRPQRHLEMVRQLAYPTQAPRYAGMIYYSRINRFNFAGINKRRMAQTGQIIRRDYKLIVSMLFFRVNKKIVARVTIMLDTDNKFIVRNPVKFNEPNVTGIRHGKLQCYISALLS